MDFFNQFLENIKQTVIDAIKDAIQQAKQEICEPWVTTKEIAEHLGQSESWVNKNLHIIPHIKHEGSKRFKKSAVDQWRVETYGQNYDLKKVAVSQSKISSKRPVKFIE